MAIQSIEKTQTGHFTVADLIALPDDDKRYELIDGEIVEMGTSSEKHSTLGAWLARILGNYCEDHPLGGRVKGADGTYKLDDANTRVPDVSYLVPENVAKLPRGTIFCPFAPDFAIEIKSPSQSAVKMRDLARLYLRAGTRLIWLVNYEDESVLVHRPGHPVEQFAAGDTLDGLDVIPGFTVNVDEMFARIANI